MHIRIVSPSSAVKPELIEQTSQLLQSWGYEVSVGKHALSRYRGFAGTKEERTQDLNEAFTDPSVNFILCSRGGYGLAQIVDKVKVNDDKVLIGFSDITCLHSLLATQNIPSLHATMAKLGSCSDAETIMATRKAIAGEDIHYTIPAHPLNRIGKATGIMRGGNLCVFSGLHGTPYDLQAPENSILFLEDIGEPHHNVDRLMQTLRLSGALQKIKALVIGQFTNCQLDADIAPTIEETILEAMEGTTCPIVFNFPAGHVEHHLPLWMNREARLEVTKEGVSFSQNGYSIDNLPF